VSIKIGDVLASKFGTKHLGDVGGNKRISNLMLSSTKN
jgi:hypothetical protein